ncbi:unnamed protein product [Diabrotica balteata]|uniref:Uncharacterized protein n=1 Tax=Diabrotica balteata TaxID=107213 RepID=A0A9N9TAL4_DIABA|nr:unnamed protein product [Diabrotica balteata]
MLLKYSDYQLGSALQTPGLNNSGIAPTEYETTTGNGATGTPVGVVNVTAASQQQPLGPLQEAYMARDRSYPPQHIDNEVTYAELSHVRPNSLEPIKNGGNQYGTLLHRDDPTIYAQIDHNRRPPPLKTSPMVSPAMNESPRSFKILSKVTLTSEDKDGASSSQHKNKVTVITDVNKPVGKSEPKVVILSDVSNSSLNSDYLSDPLKSLKECIEAQKTLNVSREDLEENIDPNISGNEDFVQEIIALDNTDILDAFIDLDSLNNADVTIEEVNYKNNRRWDNVLNSDKEKLEITNSTNFTEASKGNNANEIRNSTSFENNIDINAAKKEISGLHDDSLEKESSSEAEKNVAADNDIKKRKRKKNRLSDSQDWEYNTNKKKRQEGAAYKGRKDNKFLVQKHKRKLKIRCSCEEKTSDISKILELYMGRKKSICLWKSDCLKYQKSQKPKI